MTQMREQAKTIHWKPVEGLKYPALKKSGSTWLIYTQETLKLEALEKKTIGLNFGYMFSDGLILTFATDAIKQSLEIKTPFHCNNNTDNIKTILYNFSKNPVMVPANTPFCFVKYFKA